MSDLTALIAIAFLFVAGGFLIIQIAQRVNSYGDEIVTGVVSGTPVSTGTRRARLFFMWLPFQGASTGTTFLLAVAMAEITQRVGDEGAKTVAYFAAFMFGTGSIMALVTAVSGFFQYRALLQRAKR